MNINENWITVELFYKLVFKYKTGFCVWHWYNPLLLFKILPHQLISFFVFGEYSIFFCYILSFLVIISCRDKYDIGISVFYRSLWTLSSRSIRLMPAPRARVCTHFWHAWMRRTWWTRCAWPLTNWWRSWCSIARLFWTIFMEPPVSQRSSRLSR